MTENSTPQRSDQNHAKLSGDLQTWENSFRVAIDSIPGLAWFGSAEGPVEFLNQQWCDFTGIPMDDALGWGWASTIHPEDQPGLEAHWRVALTLGLPGETEARVRRFDGTYRWFLFRYAPLRDSLGRVVKWYGCNIDIEDRKLAEKALLASEQLARGQVNALKSALDTLAQEPDPDLLVAHIMRTMTEQFGADSASVWRPGSFDEKLTLDFVFEEGTVVPATDIRFDGLDLALPMGEIWPWPTALRLARPSAIADISALPAFPLRDRLLPLGIVTVLLVPMTVAGRLEGAIGLRFTVKRAFETESLGLAQALANQAMLMIKLAELSAQGREAAVVKERNRIARDIHDTLAQGFTGIIVQLEAAEDASRRSLGHEAEQHVVTARNLARESLREARRSVRALRPQPLQECQLTTAVQALFARLPEGAALRATFKVQGPTWRLPPEWEENLFRITQEVLTNVLRHAGATLLVGKITFHAQGVLVEFADDGKGFDPAAISEGFGLLGMRERVDEMGGQMQIRSARAQGTTLSIRLPSSPPDAADARE